MYLKIDKSVEPVVFQDLLFPSKYKEIKNYST